MTTPEPATAPAAPVEPAASSEPVAPGEPGRGVLGPVRDLWARTPLLVRLVGITTVLLATGLAIAGTATTTLLSRYLMTQFDERLKANNTAYADYVERVYKASGSLASLEDNAFLGSKDFAMRAVMYDAPVTVLPDEEVTQKYGTPDLPDVDPDSLVRATTVTFGSDVRGSAWRGIATPIRVTSLVTGDTTVVGYLLYAEPLAEVQNTVRQVALLLWSSALAILVIGGVVATWAVRRSLRGLREIEATAARIADGDLSERVPPAPETTEVGRLGAALNSMLTQIEVAFDERTRSEERMRRFVADASHELRTPLAAIRGYGELYRMGALTEKDQVDDTMRRIEQSATRMGGLVEDLLALARLDANRPDRAEPVDLAVLATDAAHDLRALDPTRQVRVGALDGATGPGTVVAGDESRLRQVMANLVGNIARHTPAGSPAELSVGRVGERVVVEVRDHGPGIAPEHARRVFERFYRVDPSRTREGNGTGGGAGLGMAIVAAIVEAHHGEVTLTRTPGGGATVRVALPAGDHAPAPRTEDHPPA